MAEADRLMATNTQAFAASAMCRARGPFGINKASAGLSLVATITDASEGNVVQFFTRAMTLVASSYVDSAGEAFLYDVDDGAYTAYEVTTGNAWSIVVVGSTATVTPIASTGIAGFAHFG
jgi:hypothetical protein